MPHIKMTNVLSKTQNVSLDPCLFGFDIIEKCLVPHVRKNPISEDFSQMQLLKCATERCPCHNTNIPCCFFCKCCSRLLEWKNLTAE